MLEMDPFLGISAVVSLITLLVLLRSRTRHRLSLPPAPPLPKTKTKPWLYWTEASEKYGDILYFKVGRKTMIVLNSAQAVHDLMEKRSGIYSSRPRMILSEVARGGGKVITTAPYGARWRSMRRLAHSALMAKAADNYKPWQLLESSVLLNNLLESPDQWARHLPSFAASVVTQMSWGIRVKGTDDPLLKVHEGMLTRGIKRLASNTIVDQYPILRFAPSSWIPALKEAREAYRDDMPFFRGLYQQVQDRIEQGNAPWSFSRDLQSRNMSEHDLDRDSLALLASIPLLAGIDTTNLVLRAFLFAVACYGEEFLPQAKAELDTVVGTDHAPTFDDLKQMPYNDAMGKEVLRWSRTSPFGVPHALIEDDLYGGYRIPKGTTILPNYYKIHWDPHYYPRPEVFRPERFLEEKRDFPGAMGHYGFGVGRRVCPGIHVAENAFNLAIARLVWAFDIVSTGSPDRSEDNYRDAGVANEIIKIPVTFRVRSERHVQIIRDDYSSAEIELKQCETTYKKI